MVRVSNEQLAQDVLLQRKVQQAGERYKRLFKEKGPQDSATLAAGEEFLRLRRQLVGQAADYLV